MKKEHSAWSEWPGATEQLECKEYFGMSKAERLQIVLRSDYGEQTTNNEEFIRVEEEMKAQK